MGDGCAPGKTCCDDCKDGAPPATERVLVQAGRGLAAGSRFQVLTQGGDVVTWGPASTESVSEDAKLVRMSAIEQALPNFFEVGTLTFLHKDQNVVRVEPMLQLDPSKVPAGPARDLAGYLVRRYGGAPTGVLEVTAELVQAFPAELAPHLGRKAFFVGARIPSKTDTQRIIQQEILANRMDAYSISAYMHDTEKRPVCEGDECRIVEEVHRLDLSAVTLGAKRDGAGPLSGKVRNKGAAFLVLQQAAGVKSDTPKPVAKSLRDMNPPAATPDAPAGTAPPVPEVPPVVEQAKAPEPAAVTPPAEPAKVVEQSDAPPVPGAPSDAPADAPEEPKDEKADLLRRVEALEQRMATMPSTPANPAPAPAPEAPKLDEKTVEQAVAAHLAKTQPILEQAAVQTAVKAAEDRFKALLLQARPADTPTPASPADPAKTREAAVLEAARSGDPVKLLAVLEGLKATTGPTGG